MGISSSVVWTRYALDYNTLEVLLKYSLLASVSCSCYHLHIFIFSCCLLMWAIISRGVCVCVWHTVLSLLYLLSLRIRLFVPALCVIPVPLSCVFPCLFYIVILCICSLILFRVLLLSLCSKHDDARISLALVCPNNNNKYFYVIF